MAGIDAGAGGDDQGGDAEDEGEGGHQDRPHPDARGLQPRLLDAAALLDGALAPTERGRTLWTPVAPLYATPSAADSGADAMREALFSTTFTASMEDGLDQVALGDTSAAERWETWRDQIRHLHEVAKDRRNAGPSTPRQHEQLQRLLARVPAGADVAALPTDLKTLSYQEARDHIARLLEAGVEPAPSQAQLDEVARLLEALQLTDTERHAIVGAGDINGIATSARASRIIDELRRVHDARLPPSAKQRRLIDELIQEAAISAADAAALAGVDSLGDLTGGRGGSASTLIARLKDRIGRTTDT